jgi:hypothetical protein
VALSDQDWARGLENGVQRGREDTLEEVSFQEHRGPFQQERKHGAGLGGLRGAVLAPQHHFSPPSPQLLHNMENSTGNFRAVAPRGQSQAGWGGVGTPPLATVGPHPALELSPDRVCGDQTRVEFPVASWLA